MKGLGLAPIRVLSDDDPEEYIEIKAKLSRGDRELYVNRIMAYTNQFQVDIKTIDWLTPMLELAVVGWNLKTEDGQPWEFKPERIRELPHDSDLLDKVQDVIAEANPTFSSRAFRTARSGSTN